MSHWVELCGKLWNISWETKLCWNLHVTCMGPCKPPVILPRHLHELYAELGEVGGLVMTSPFALVRDENAGRENRLSIPQEVLCSWLPALKVRIRSVVVTGVAFAGVAEWVTWFWSLSIKTSRGMLWFYEYYKKQNKTKQKAVNWE